MNELVEELAEDRLIWLEQLGIGYLEARPDGVYDQAYFDKYRRLRRAPMANALNDFRTNLVLTHGVGTVIDVGIGDGAFLERLWERGGVASGFDVNPAAIRWLEERGVHGDLYGSTWDTATFWDSLEHIRDPRPALAAVRRVLIASLPLFCNVEHVLASRHYRPDEHFWYFTPRGLATFLGRAGFEVVDLLWTETELGRDSVGTVVARRAG